mmetsp:Transcript_13933/g.26024  ORF Transcript_13933/g.26024 Transcript_13933/m.26024 type:complete len:214 (+) Transcript_13933:860-1501(+)
MGAGVQPGVAAAHDLDAELAAPQVLGVHISDLQLTAGAGLDIGRDVADLLVIEIQAGDRVVALRRLGLFFDGQGALVGIELDHAIALGVGHVIGEHAGARVACGGIGQQAREVVSVEDVVTQDQGAGRASDKLAAEDEGLGQAVRAGLHAVADVQAPARTVAQQRLEARRVLRCADQQDVADAREHQRAQRVIDHRLVVDRQQLLAHRQRGRV